MGQPSIKGLALAGAGAYVAYSYWDWKTFPSRDKDVDVMIVDTVGLFGSKFGIHYDDDRYSVTRDGNDVWIVPHSLGRKVDWKTTPPGYNMYHFKKWNNVRVMVSKSDVVVYNGQRFRDTTASFLCA